jgi:hypothetical protein
MVRRMSPGESWSAEGFSLCGWRSIDSQRALSGSGRASMILISIVGVALFPLPVREQEFIVRRAHAPRHGCGG